MSANPDAAMPTEAADAQVASRAETKRRPSLALFMATAGGLGYIPVAPGTWGSIAGVAIWALTRFYFPLTFVPGSRETYLALAAWLAVTSFPVALVIAIAGIWASNRAAEYSGTKDPQFVVIDEVSGQHVTYLLALAPLNWKYLLLGFILFRIFDIWKPFPARQAESLPGGWGIMADDWVAGIYAAIGLWIARAAGL
jgi:phosphatidylglycerophosphatase A